MSCREKAGGRLVTAVARDSSGLNDAQVSNTLHRLVREARQLEEQQPNSLPQPTRQSVSIWAAQTVQTTLAANPTMSENHRRKLQEWAEQVSEDWELPDAALFHAWQHLEEETKSSAANLETMYNTIAQKTGTTPQEVRERVDSEMYKFEALTNGSNRKTLYPPSARAALLKFMREDGYLAEGQTIPDNPATLSALRKLQQEANFARPPQSTPGEGEGEGEASGPVRKTTDYSPEVRREIQQLRKVLAQLRRPVDFYGDELSGPAYAKRENQNRAKEARLKAAIAAKHPNFDFEQFEHDEYDEDEWDRYSSADY